MPTLDEQYAYVRRLLQHVHNLDGPLAERSEWMREPNVVLDSDQRNITQLRLPSRSSGYLDGDALAEFRRSLPELLIAQFLLMEGGNNRTPVDLSWLFAEGGLPPRLRMLSIAQRSATFGRDDYRATIETFRHLPRGLGWLSVECCAFSSPPTRAVPLADLPPRMLRFSLGSQSAAARAALKAVQETREAFPPLLLCGSIIDCAVVNRLLLLHPAAGADSLSKTDVVVGDAELFGPNTRSVITCRQFLNLAHKYQRGTLSADTARALSMTGEFAADAEFVDEHRAFMD
jgi:hypothetical protein